MGLQLLGTWGPNPKKRAFKEPVQYELAQSTHWSNWCVTKLWRYVIVLWPSFNVVTWDNHVGSNPALVATYGPWESPSLAVTCGALAWNSDTVSMLHRDHLWVVMDLKSRSRNNLNEWMNELLPCRFVTLQCCWRSWHCLLHACFITYLTTSLISLLKYINYSFSDLTFYNLFLDPQ